MPTTMKTLVFGKSSLIAPPEVVAKYGPPPGGGRISARQKMPTAVDGGGHAPAGNASERRRSAPRDAPPGTAATRAGAGADARGASSSSWTPTAS